MRRPIEFEYLKVNDVFGRLAGVEDVEGRLVSEVIPEIRGTNPELFEAYGRVARAGRRRSGLDQTKQ